MYILRCRGGSFYTGATKDLDARLRLHQAGRASRYTRAHLPVTLAWSRPCASWGTALSEEHRIKRMRRVDKEALVLAGKRKPAGRRAGLSGRGLGKA